MQFDNRRDELLIYLDIRMNHRSCYENNDAEIFWLHHKMCRKNLEIQMLATEIFLNPKRELMLAFLKKI